MGLLGSPRWPQSSMAAFDQGRAPPSLEAAALAAVRLYCLVPCGVQPCREEVWGSPSALSMASPRQPYHTAFELPSCLTSPTQTQAPGEGNLAALQILSCRCEASRGRGQFHGRPPGREHRPSVQCRPGVTKGHGGHPTTKAGCARGGAVLGEKGRC